MSNKEIFIVKRDGKRVPFSIEKIRNAIAKAFLSVGAFAAEEDFIVLLSHLHVSDGMTVEEIQNQVETALMREKYFAVAKAYMLYRQKHTETREIQSKMNFLIHGKQVRCQRQRREEKHRHPHRGVTQEEFH